MRFKAHNNIFFNYPFAKRQRYFSDKSNDTNIWFFKSTYGILLQIFGAGSFISEVKDA